MEIISSSKNEKVKSIVALSKHRKNRTETGLFTVEGLRIAADTVKSASKLIEKIVVSESFLKSRAWEEYREFDGSGFPENYPVMAVTDSVFASMSETVTPQGIMCVVRQPVYTYESMTAQERIKLLILEDIQDPGNLGTMIRTAEAAGVNGIIMSKGTVDIFSPKVTRSTMGAIFRVPFVYTDDLPGTLDRLKDDGVDVYAAYLRNGTLYRDVKYSKRAAVMIGNEGNGLSNEAVARARMNVFIPMEGEAESLNAAIAAALLMYEL